MPVHSFTIDTQCAEDRYAAVHIVRDLDGVRELYHDWLIPRRDQWIGCDSETNGVDPFHAPYKLRMLQFADNREAWVIDTQRVGPAAVKALVRAHHSLVAHFSENDLRFIERGAPGSVDLASDTPHIYDNQVALGYYDPRTLVSADKPNIDRRLIHAKGLKPTSTREFPSVVTGGASALEQAESEFDLWSKTIAPTGHKTGKKLKTWRFAHVPFEEQIYQVYGAMDPLFTIRLWHKELAEIQRRGQWQIVKDDLDWQWDIDRMTLRGLPVDEPYARWLDKHLREIVERNTPLLAHYGVPPSASGSSPAVGLAFEDMGAVSPKVDENSGRRSYDKDVLKTFATWNGPVGELARIVTQSRKATKFAAAYVLPMIQAVDLGDGRVHCSFRAIGTTTGRNSAARPALQQVPKKSTVVRSAYGGVPGWVFVSCDMKTGEPRVMAARSGDLGLAHDIDAGDINGAIAAIAFGASYDPAEGKTAGTTSYFMRQGGKVGFLAGCYGAGNAKIDEQAGVPKGTGLMDRWRAGYSRLFAYGETLNNQPYLQLDSGRVCRLWDRYTVGENDELRMWGKPSRLGLNYDTQGSQSDILRIAWRRMREAGWASYCALFVHDEIVMHVPESLAEACRQALEIAMTIPMWNGRTMECEATVEGPTWLPQPDAFSDDSIDFVM
jgi:DNA polymerase I